MNDHDDITVLKTQVDFVLEEMKKFATKGELSAMRSMYSFLVAIVIGLILSLGRHALFNGP